jgi:phage terminase small subunit
MPRKRQPDHIRLLNGRAPGRDSGGRPVPDPRPVGDDDDPAPAPPMPRNRLSLPVRKVWRRTVPELRVTPDQDAFVAYCRAIVQQDDIAARIEAGELIPEGTQARLAAEIRRFRREFMTAPVPALTMAAPAAVADNNNPFAAAADSEGRRRKVPSLIRCLPTRPMPKNYVENPCPPEDPRFHQVWVAAIQESDRNHGIKRPPGFYTREFHYDGFGELWDEYWPPE